jgi:hypothetical protein
MGTDQPVNRDFILETSPQPMLGLPSGAPDHTGCVATRTGRHGGDRTAGKGAGV